MSVVLALVGWFVVGVATQPEPAGPGPRVIDCLVLDGSGVTTTGPPSVRRRPEPIPRRELGEAAATTTTTEGCE